MKSLITLTGIVLVSLQASAHSDYWRCAVGAGSASNVEAQCGTRADYDRRVNEENNRRYEEQRREEERNRWHREQEERRERDEREYRDRRDREEREYRDRQERNRYNPPSYNPPSYRPTPRPAPVETGVFTKTLTLDQVLTNSNVSVGAKLNLSQYDGADITKIEIEAERADASTAAVVKILIQGSLFKTYELTEGVSKVAYELSNVVIDRKLSNVVVEVEGSAKIKRVRLTIDR